MTKTEKPLTQAQVRYARQRVEALTEQKIKAIYAERDADPLHSSRCYDRGGKILTEEIRAGRFTINKDAVRIANYDTSVHSILIFKKYPGGMAEAERASKAIRNAYEERANAVRTESVRIIDDLVLGDAEKAIVALLAFESKTF